MKNVYKLAAGVAGSTLLLLMGSAANAQAYPDVGWSINIGTPAPIYAPAPVVMAPRPVYRHGPVLVAPAPVIYQAPMMRPRPVYVQQAPVYYGAPGWQRGYGHGPHERWEHRGHGRDHGHGWGDRGNGRGDNGYGRGDNGHGRGRG